MHKFSNAKQEINKNYCSYATEWIIIEQSYVIMEFCVFSHNDQNKTRSQLQLKTRSERARSVSVFLFVHSQISTVTSRILYEYFRIEKTEENIPNLKNK